MPSIHDHEELYLFFDGSCESKGFGKPRNPGGVATCGWLITSHLSPTWKEGRLRIPSAETDILVQDSKVISDGGPKATNNIAEYCALGFGLRHLVDAGWKGILYIYGDSQLVIRQLTGEYQCRAPHLQKLKARCEEMLKEIGEFHLEWIERDRNSLADALSQRAYVEYTGKPYPKTR